MGAKRGLQKFGTLQRDLPFLKDAIDYQLTRFPRLYLFIEQFREWTNWDKRVYLSLVRPGNNVLDVGANVGAHSVFLSHLVRAKGKVLAFEPLEPNVEAFRETLRRRSRIDNIRVFTRAVGNPRSIGEEVTMKVPAGDLTQASLETQSAGSWKGTSTIQEYRAPLTSIDGEKDVQALPHIDFVKIDVEGGELNVLKGAARTLSQLQPIIYSELYERWTAPFGYAPADVFVFLRTLGYEQARVISGGEVHAMAVGDPIDPALFTNSSDVLFFAGKHRGLVAEFDRRYRVSATSR